MKNTTKMSFRQDRFISSLLFALCIFQALYFCLAWGFFQNIQQSYTKFHKLQNRKNCLVCKINSAEENENDSQLGLQTRKDFLRSSALIGTLSSTAIAPKSSFSFCGDPFPQWAFMLNFNDGVIPYKGSELYIREIGDERREKKLKMHPLIVIPGGPGFSHDYLETIEAVAQTERRVLLFDPIGTGQSSRKSIQTTPQDLVSQVNALIKALGIKEYHIYAHGSGVPAALEKLKEVQQQGDKGERVLSLVLASPFEKGADLGQQFSQKAWKENPEARSTLLSSKKAAPICLEESLKTSDATQVFSSLKDWDCSSYMQFINCPVAITYGRNDLVPEASVIAFKDNIPADVQSKVQVRRFEKSSHLPHLEEKEDYLLLLQNFLNEVDNEKATKKKKQK